MRPRRALKFPDVDAVELRLRVWLSSSAAGPQVPELSKLPPLLLLLSSVIKQALTRQNFLEHPPHTQNRGNFTLASKQVKKSET